MPSADFIHRFIPGALASAPTILTLHGTGGDENDLVPLARMVDGDSAILSLRGRVSEGGKARFFRGLPDGMCDLEDLRDQTLALARFIDAAAQHFRFNRARTVALGYSNGANIAASLMLSVPGALAGAILLRPMLPFEPVSPPPLKGTPILVSAGRNDPLVPATLTEKLTDTFREQGASVNILWQDTRHALSPSELEQVAVWWRRTFGAEEGMPGA